MKLDQLIREGVISPVKTSKWAAPHCFCNEVKWLHKDLRQLY